MSDFLPREDVAAVPESSALTSGFARGGSKQAVAFSDAPVPPASEPSPGRDSAASSLSSEEEEEATPRLPASEEQDPRCRKGVCADAEEDGELCGPEPPVSPAASPWGAQEEEAEDGEDKFAFRKLNGEWHDSDVNNRLPVVIRCFQVVSPSACSPKPRAGFGAGPPNTAASRCQDPKGLCLLGSDSCSELLSRLISRSQCTQAPLNLSFALK